MFSLSTDWLSLIAPVLKVDNKSTTLLMRMENPVHHDGASTLTQNFISYGVCKERGRMMPSESMSGLVASSPSCVFDGIKFHTLLARSASPTSTRGGCLGGNSSTQEKYATVQCWPQLGGLPNLVLEVQCPHCIILFL
ncbi:hypothetical protein C2845_PM10G00100 [Panicum miliaceum]|uniref:Uncharacterized protein n=1 Tax=Panicum miliaceum TaxID=4540 RepID=A0A3L6PCZ3_PANMI|nr:hypothetical protein C2845_PM10G00100 [Panicum miliaceum]